MENEVFDIKYPIVFHKKAIFEEYQGFFCGKLCGKCGKDPFFRLFLAKKGDMDGSREMVARVNQWQKRQKWFRFRQGENVRFF